MFLQLVEEQTQQDILNFRGLAGNPSTLSERMETLFNFIAKNEDYFSKQTLIWVDFYQQQDHTEVINNETLKQADEQTRLAIADYMQISDTALVDFVLNLLYRVLLRRVFGDETVSFAEQGELLAKMLSAYLDLTKL